MTQLRRALDETFTLRLLSGAMIESDLNAMIAETADAAGVFWQRFEIPMFPGIPDGYLGRPLNIWVESKVTNSDFDKPRFRPGQLPWALRAGRRGEVCLTLSANIHTGQIRVLDTPGIAEAEALGKDWPEPMLWSSHMGHLFGWMRNMIW